MKKKSAATIWKKDKKTNFLQNLDQEKIVMVKRKIPTEGIMLSTILILSTPFKQKASQISTKKAVLICTKINQNMTTFITDKYTNFE